VDGDYYHPLTGTFLTRRSAGTNEYSAGVNPVDSWADVVQDILDLVGVVDPTGVVDVVNAVGYALRGKWGSAAVTALGIIPYVGDVAKAGKAGHAVALATRGARQVARGAEGASQRAIVIGENMNRVRNAAKALGASYYRAWRIEPFDAQRALRRNEAWIRRKVREEYLIYDIGIDLARDYRSPFYAMERRVLREMGVEPVPIY